MSPPQAHLERIEQIAATSEEAYEDAARRFNEVSSTYIARRRALQEQLRLLDAEWEEAAANLRLHEDTGGIPLYNRCPRCAPGRALPIGHAGECRT